MVDWYTEYAELIFEELGPKVKVFITINEPLIACRGYRDKTMSPGSFKIFQNVLTITLYSIPILVTKEADYLF